MTAPESVTADAPEPASAPVITDAWPELHALACAQRADWKPVEWLGIFRACRDSGLPYKEVYTEVMRLNWDLATRHEDALAEVRNLGRKLARRPAPRGSPDRKTIAALLAGDYEAAYKATHDGAVPVPRVSTTGPQQALTEDDDREEAS